MMLGVMAASTGMTFASVHNSVAPTAPPTMSVRRPRVRDMQTYRTPCADCSASQERKHQLRKEDLHSEVRAAVAEETHEEGRMRVQRAVGRALERVQAEHQRCASQGPLVSIRAHALYTITTLCTHSRTPMLVPCQVRAARQPRALFSDFMEERKGAGAHQVYL